MKKYYLFKIKLSFSSGIREEIKLIDNEYMKSIAGPHKGTVTRYIIYLCNNLSQQYSFSEKFHGVEVKEIFNEKIKIKKLKERCENLINIIEQNQKELLKIKCELRKLNNGQKNF